MKIYKYKLEITDIQRLDLPRGAKFLSAQFQHGKLCVWVLLNGNEKMMQIRDILIIGTGNPISWDMHNFDFIDTVQMHGGSLVWHVFAEKPLS